ncbi:hypothetical protein HDU96_009838 [Phlyctochytrium bullatum]|nr:hypothetical protein HDU96_009838 [Phlyctochytrium bullatum]
MLLLYAAIITTRSEWWASNTEATLFAQQAATAVVGFFVGSMVRDASWMAQGALASGWAFRSRSKLALAVAEAIQIGVPSLIFNTREDLIDKGIIMVIPLVAGLLNAVYKFGITIGRRISYWRGIIRTVYVDQPLDLRPVIVWGGCNGTYDPCKQQKLLSRIGAVNAYPDLDDFAFTQGVDFGRATTNTSYTLKSGDVPSMDFAVRGRILWGVRFTQLYMESMMDCSRSPADPWPDTICDVPNRTVVGNSTEVSRFTVCNPVQQSQIRGVVTFFPQSLNVSCLYNISVFTREIAATPINATWDISVLSPPVPIGNDVLTPTRIGMKYFSPLRLSQAIKRDTQFPCFGAVCKDNSKDFVSGVSANAIFMLTNHVYWFLHSNKDPEIAEEEPLVPFTGRVLLSGNTTTSWLPVWTATGLQNLTAAPGAWALVGATADMAIVDGTFVQIEYWVLAFGLLVVLQIVTAAVKIWNHTHPLEAVGGFVWTLRKVDPDIAKDFWGVGLAELLNRSRWLTLGRTEPFLDGRPGFLTLAKKADYSAELFNGEVSTPYPLDDDAFDTKKKTASALDIDKQPKPIPSETSDPPNGTREDPTATASQSDTLATNTTSAQSERPPHSSRDRSSVGATSGYSSYPRSVGFTASDKAHSTLPAQDTDDHPSPGSHIGPHPTIASAILGLDLIASPDLPLPLSLQTSTASSPDAAPAGQPRTQPLRTPPPGLHPIETSPTALYGIPPPLLGTTPAPPPPRHHNTSSRRHPRNRSGGTPGSSSTGKTKSMASSNLGFDPQHWDRKWTMHMRRAPTASATVSAAAGRTATTRSPPTSATVRGKRSRERLAGSGGVDDFATDHAPHPRRQTRASGPTTFGSLFSSGVGTRRGDSADAPPLPAVPITQSPSTADAAVIRSSTPEPRPSFSFSATPPRHQGGQDETTAAVGSGPAIAPDAMRESPVEDGGRWMSSPRTQPPEVQTERKGKERAG